MREKLRFIVGIVVELVRDLVSMLALLMLISFFALCFDFVVHYFFGVSLLKVSIFNSLHLLR
jgi:hypothetical protein